MICFQGRITDFNEFNKNFNLIIDNYKGKKTGKEYDEAIKLLKDHINIDKDKEIDNISINSKQQEKKSIFGGLFGNKNK